MCLPKWLKGIEGGSGIFSSSGTGVALTPTINQVTSGQPQAYARIVIVDEDGNELQEQFELISNTANTYNSLNLQLAVEHDGYAIVYLANESMMDVFFDELRVKHERLVWQENNYYPFGLAIKPLVHCITLGSDLGLGLIPSLTKFCKSKNLTLSS